MQRQHACRDQIPGVIADDGAEPQIIEIGRLQQKLAGDRHFRRAIGQGDEAFVRGQRFGPCGVIGTKLHAAQNVPAQLTLHLGTELLQLILDHATVGIAGLDHIAAPAERIGQLDQAGIAVIQLMSVDRPGRAGGEADGVGRIGLRTIGVPVIAGAGIAFDAHLFAIGARIAEIEKCVPAIVAFIFGVQPAAVQIRLPIEDIVADHALHIVERPGGVLPVHHIAAAAKGGAEEGEGQLDAALGLVVVEIRIEAVSGQRDLVANAGLHRTVEAKALQQCGRDEGFGTGGHHIAAAIGIEIAPGVELLNLIGFFGIGR